MYVQSIFIVFFHEAVNRQSLKLYPQQTLALSPRCFHWVRNKTLRGPNAGGVCCDVIFNSPPHATYVHRDCSEDNTNDPLFMDSQLISQDRYPIPTSLLGPCRRIRRYYGLIVMAFWTGSARPDMLVATLLYLDNMFPQTPPPTTDVYPLTHRPRHYPLHTTTSHNTMYSTPYTPPPTLRFTSTRLDTLPTTHNHFPQHYVPPYTTLPWARLHLRHYCVPYAIFHTIPFNIPFFLKPCIPSHTSEIIIYFTPHLTLPYT